MPLKGSQDDKFDEFRHGKTFAKSQRKFGVQKARKQMVAAVLNSGKKSKKKTRKRA